MKRDGCKPGKNWLLLELNNKRNKWVKSTSYQSEVYLCGNSITDVLTENYRFNDVTKIPKEFDVGGMCHNKLIRSTDITACGMSLRDEEGVVAIDTRNCHLIIDSYSKYSHSKDVQYRKAFIPITSAQCKGLKNADDDHQDMEYGSWDAKESLKLNCGFTAAEKTGISKCIKTKQKDELFRDTLIRRCMDQDVYKEFQKKNGYNPDATPMKKGCSLPAELKPDDTIRELLQQKRTTEKELAKQLSEYTSKGNPITIKRIKKVYHNAKRPVPFVLEFEGGMRLIIDYSKYGFEAYPDCEKLEGQIEAKRKKRANELDSVFCKLVEDLQKSYKPDVILPERPDQRTMDEFRR